MEIVAAGRVRGRAECEADVVTGRLQFYCQIRGAWGEYMKRLMDEQFGVTVIPTSDVTSVAQVSFRAGYNQRLAEHINSTFGDASCETAMADVDAFRQQRYREYFARKEQS